MTEYEMVGWHHRLDGHEFEQAPGVGDGQESLRYDSENTKNDIIFNLITHFGNSLGM